MSSMQTVIPAASWIEWEQQHPMLWLFEEKGKRRLVAFAWFITNSNGASVTHCFIGDKNGMFRIENCTAFISPLDEREVTEDITDDFKLRFFNEAAPEGKNHTEQIIRTPNHCLSLPGIDGVLKRIKRPGRFLLSKDSSLMQIP